MGGLCTPSRGIQVFRSFPLWLVRARSFPDKCLEPPHRVFGTVPHAFQPLSLPEPHPASSAPRDGRACWGLHPPCTPESAVEPNTGCWPGSPVSGSQPPLPAVQGVKTVFSRIGSVMQQFEAWSRVLARSRSRQSSHPTCLAEAAHAHSRRCHDGGTRSRAHL